jgi:hypothetical protein
MSNIQHYVQELNKFSTNSAKSIIQTAAILVEAKQELNNDDYSAFLSRTKYDKNSSAIRKLEAIGKAQSRLETVCHLLPANWTTIYKIALLPVHDFKTLVDEEHLHPLVKASEIDAVTKNIQPKPPKLQITLELDPQTDSATAIKLIDDIQTLKPIYLFQIKPSVDIKNLIKT